MHYIMVHVASSKLWLYLDEWTGWLVQVALWVGGQGAGEEGRAQVYRYAGEPENIVANPLNPVEEMEAEATNQVFLEKYLWY